MHLYVKGLLISHITNTMVAVKLFLSGTNWPQKGIWEHWGIMQMLARQNRSDLILYFGRYNYELINSNCLVDQKFDDLRVRQI